MELTPEQFKMYMKMLKENEQLRRSFNERQRLWEEYMKTVKKGRSETSFNMNVFG